MGTDKALLTRPDGATWLEHAAGLLGGVCEAVWVSARADQMLPTPAGVDIIVDGYKQLGPAAGLLSAWDRFPDRPWLVLATDMPWVHSDHLRLLLRTRDPNATATVFRHSDGFAEPLCAVWEPQARPTLQCRVARGDASLSALLKVTTVNWLAVADPSWLASANTPVEGRRLKG
jgi:molybdopterin-guanine dinucleotide biosynthesis protein A